LAPITAHLRLDRIQFCRRPCSCEAQKQRGAVCWRGRQSRGFGLLYALQIYFDFSGYTDMAIGLALAMGVTFPLNFDSPYKSASLVEFWRRWHMSLSRFLRNYLYIPLGGNRHGAARRYVNLLSTMILGGLWHGASWNFVLWGAIHGVGLGINHVWRDFCGRLGWSMPRGVGVVITFLLVILAWVPFRADNLSASIVMWQAMLQLPSVSDIQPTMSRSLGWIVIILSAIALFAPNSQQMLGLTPRQSSHFWFEWSPTLKWGMVVGTLFGVAVVGTFVKPTYFL
jgi:alginate O-acetyltransferase complex protein AlgI